MSARPQLHAGALSSRPDLEWVAARRHRGDADESREMDGHARRGLSCEWRRSASIRSEGSVRGPESARLCSANFESDSDSPTSTRLHFADSRARTRTEIINARRHTEMQARARAQKQHTAAPLERAASLPNGSGSGGGGGGGGHGCRFVVAACQPVRFYRLGRVCLGRLSLVRPGPS